ncbi:MAG: beta-lactamase family protein [Sphingomonadaceae bacterium]|nr:beta-lactamase family protein [Sphingomonadaceae bacterium]
MDRRRFLLGLGATTGLALIGCSPAPRGSAAAPEAAPASAWPATRAYVESFVASQPIPGAIVAVGRGDEPPTYLAAGRVALDSTVLVDANSLWRVYSMTKPVTGIAAMILVGEGRLGLDQNIAELLPEWASPRVLTDPATSLDARPAARPITVRHLLTHTAGLGYTIITQGPLLAEYQRLGLTPAHLGPDMQPRPDGPQSLDEFSRRLATLPLIADPGARWSYSMSLDLLGRVIEVAAGMPFERFLATRMFAPLGMNDTFFQVPPDKVARMTANYTIADGRATVTDPARGSVYEAEPPYPFGGAGLVSSAHDYDRFLAMLLGEGETQGARIMSAETARLAMSNIVPDGTDMTGMFIPTGFGAGGRVSSVAMPGGEGVGTYGWSGAAGTHAWVDRANNVRAAGFVQHFPYDATDFGQQIARAIYADLAAAA